MARKCSVARTLALVGERWSLLILREIFLGVRRFDAIQANTGAPRAALASRLRTLEDAGVIQRTDYRAEGSRTRQEYRPTSAGKALQPVLTALMQWGDAHLVEADGPPLSLTHNGCGAPVRATLTCAAGHQLDDTGRDLTAEQLR